MSTKPRKIKISRAEIARGTKDELEHTKKTKVAAKIARTHLKKHPLYYDKTVGLPALEKKLTKIEKVKFGKKK
jgi:hypothetical protein